MGVVICIFEPSLVQSFAPASISPTAIRALRAYDGQDDDAEEPFFEMQKIPTATTGSRLDRMVDCAENSGLCDVDEVSAMIEELELLNSECNVSTSRECSLDAVAARNVLKVALASTVLSEEDLVASVECATHNAVV